MRNRTRRLLIAENINPLGEPATAPIPAEKLEPGAPRQAAKKRRKKPARR